MKNVLKLLFDLGLGGMRQHGCSKCHKGAPGQDSFESRRFEKGKTTLQADDFEQIIRLLDKLKSAIESDPALLNFAERFEKDPWNSIQFKILFNFQG